MTPPNVNRRDFLKQSAAGAAAVGTAASLLGAPSPARAKGANERIGVGIIGTGNRANGRTGHLNVVMDLQKAGQEVEVRAVCDVFEGRLGPAQSLTGAKGYRDYRKLLEDPAIDVVGIITPDHWHAKMTIDAAEAGKDVYCEKPMTHTIEQAAAVVKAVRANNRVMQVGVQSTSDTRWQQANDLVTSGRIGKVVQGQTSYYRNSAVGQWRYYKLTEDMTPRTIDWDMWLGHEFGLAPKRPFDRAVYAQWRCYWDFGGGMYTDLFVHQLTHLIRAIGVRFPRRVVGGGGVYLEYDERDVPDVATVVADYEEGLQVIVTATMVNDHPIEEVIRGHLGTIKFSGELGGFDLLPQKIRNAPGGPSRDVASESEHFESNNPGRMETSEHWKNFLQCVRDRNPETHNTPELGYAAIATVNMGVQSYREGKALMWDKDREQVVPADASWANGWEAKSHTRAKPNHVMGWKAGDTGSLLEPPDYMELAGPWQDGQPPAAGGG